MRIVSFPTIARTSSRTNTPVKLVAYAHMPAMAIAPSRGTGLRRRTGARARCGGRERRDRLAVTGTGSSRERSYQRVALARLKPRPTQARLKPRPLGFTTPNVRDRVVAGARALLRKIHATKEILKTHVVAKRVEPGFYRQSHMVEVGTFRVCAFEPGECERILVAQTDIDNRQSIGGRRWPRLQLSAMSSASVRCSGYRVEVTEIRYRHAALGEADRLLK